MPGFGHAINDNRAIEKLSLPEVNVNHILNNVREIQNDGMLLGAGGSNHLNKNNYSEVNKNTDEPMTILTGASRIFYFVKSPLVWVGTSMAFVGLDINHVVKYREYINDLNKAIRGSMQNDALSSIDKMANNYSKTCNSIEGMVPDIDFEKALDMGLPKKIRDKEISEKIAPLVELIDYERKFSEKDLDLENILSWKKDVETYLKSMKSSYFELNKESKHEFIQKQYELDKVNLILCAIKVKNSNLKHLRDTIRYLITDTAFLVSDVASALGLASVATNFLNVARCGQVYSKIKSAMKFSNKTLEKIEKVLGIKENKDKSEVASIYAEMLVGFYERQIRYSKYSAPKSDVETKVNKEQFDGILKGLDLDVDKFYKSPGLKEPRSSDEMREILISAFQK